MNKYYSQFVLNDRSIRKDIDFFLNNKYTNKDSYIIKKIISDAEDQIIGRKN